jgi:hypothetical protein
VLTRGGACSGSVGSLSHAADGHAATAGGGMSAVAPPGIRPFALASSLPRSLDRHQVRPNLSFVLVFFLGIYFPLPWYRPLQLEIALMAETWRSCVHHHLHHLHLLQLISWSNDTTRHITHHDGAQTLSAVSGVGPAEEAIRCAGDARQSVLRGRRGGVDRGGEGGGGALRGRGPR